MVRLQLRMYVVGGSYLSEAALRNIRELVGDDADLEVVDVGRDSKLAREHGIVAVPALERLRPGPVRRVIGDLSDREELRKFLGCQ